MKLNHLSLSIRIAGSALILVALGALTLLFVQETHLREVYYGQRRVQLEEAFRTNEIRLIQALETLRRDVRFLAATPPISGIIRAEQNNGFDPRDGDTGQQWEERLRQILTPFLQAHPEYYQVTFTRGADADSEIVHLGIRDNRAGGVATQAVRPLPETARNYKNYNDTTPELPPDQVRLSGIMQLGKEEQAGEPTIRASVPVFDAEGRVFGLMLLGMRLQPLLQATTANLPPGVSTYIADHNGRYLFSPDGAPTDLADRAQENEILRDFPVLTTMFEPHTPDFLSLRKEESKDDFSYLTAGRMRYDPDHPDRFLLLNYELSDQMARQFTAIPRHHILIGFTVLFMICAIVLFLLRRTFAPLHQLTTAASLISADSDQVVCLPGDSGGEIGELAVAISEMLSKLSRREREIIRINAGLEEQVAERTQELTEINARLFAEVNERERVLRKLNALLQRNQALMQTAMDGIYLLDMDGNLLEANPAFYRMLGYSESEAVGLNVTDWNAQWRAEELRPRFLELIGRSTLIEAIHRRKDGTTFAVEIACSGVEIAGQKYLYAASRDISERKRAEAALRQHRVIIETARDGFWLTDMQGVLLEANEAYAQMSGYSVAELVGMHISQLEAREQTKEEVMAHIEKLIAEGYERFETVHRRKDGQEIDVEISTTYLPEEQRLFVFCHDISERKQTEEEIRTLAFHDQLTGLANRRLFLERLPAALSVSHRHGHYGAVLFLDMDNFKTLNDTRGHEAGDLMLIEVAERLRAATRDIDTVARFGGDEFVVLLEELGVDRDEALRRAGLVAEKIRRTLAQPYSINDFVHHSSPSIGVTLYRGKGASVDTLLQQADAAMYQAKNSGRNQVCFFGRVAGDLSFGGEQDGARKS